MAELAPAQTEMYRKSPIGALLSILVALLYGASPVDLIIDVIPLLGFADDVGIIALLLLFAWNLARKRKRARTAAASTSS